MTWLDEEMDNERARTDVRDKPRDDGFADFDRPLTVVRDDTGFALDAVVRAAREMGDRNEVELVRQAQGIGERMGALVKPDGNSVAFYRWKQGNSVIQGGTIDLLDALAQRWGRLWYSIKLVEERGTRAHLVGRVFDLVSLIIHERDYLAFLRPAPAKFAKNPDEAARWHTMQLQAAESRSMRGVLEHTLPAWYTEPALYASMSAFAKKALGQGETIDAAARKVLDSFASAFKVEAATLVLWVGLEPTSWTAAEISQLRQLYRQLKDGEINPGLLVALAQERAAGRADEQAEAAANANNEDRLASAGLGSQTNGAAPRGAGGASAGSERAVPPADQAGGDRTAAAPPPAGAGQPAAPGGEPGAAPGAGAPGPEGEGKQRVKVNATEAAAALAKALITRPRGVPHPIPSLLDNLRRITQRERISKAVIDPILQAGEDAGDWLWDRAAQTITLNPNKQAPPADPAGSTSAAAGPRADTRPPAGPKPRNEWQDPGEPQGTALFAKLKEYEKQLGEEVTQPIIDDLEVDEDTDEPGLRYYLYRLVWAADGDR